MNYINSQIQSHIETAKKVAESTELLSAVKAAADVIIEALKKNGKIMLAGNGGSAADSQHIAAELINRFNFDREGLYAIALTTDTSVLTSIGNDYAFGLILTEKDCMPLH